MEPAPRPLTEARIREVIAGLPAFYARLHKHDRAGRRKKLIPLPPNDVAFYADMMRMQEMWAYAQSKRQSARAKVDAAIANLRAQTAAIPSAAGAEMTSLFGEMISSRLAELESYTDEELEVVAGLSTEIGIAFMSSMKAAPGVRRRSRRK